MSLVRLIYASKGTGHTNLDNIQDIMEKAVTNNQKLDVTGFLSLNHKYFLQCLEGSRDRISALYAKILHDPRHTQVTLFQFQDIVQRQFPDWYMGYVSQSDNQRAVNIRYSINGEFNPFEMTGESSFAMLAELAGIHGPKEKQL
jgi:predicted RecB family nuclease